MVDFTLKAADVKFNFEEKFKNFKIFPPYTINNMDNENYVYAKLRIENHGDDGWYFENGESELSLDLSPNSAWNFSSKPLFDQDYTQTLPKGTHKDQVIMRVRFYENSTDRDAFNDNYFKEDILTLDISIYIQNDDGTWTSSYYTNNDDIVYEEWESNYFDSGAISGYSWFGAKSRVKIDLIGKGLSLKHYYHPDSGLWMIYYGREGQWYDSSTTIRFEDLSDNIFKLQDKVLAYMMNNYYSDIDAFYLRMVNEYYSYSISGNILKGWRKVIIYPTDEWTHGWYSSACCNARFALRITPPYIFNWLT